MRDEHLNNVVINLLMEEEGGVGGGGGARLSSARPLKKPCITLLSDHSVSNINCDLHLKSSSRLFTSQFQILSASVHMSFSAHFLNSCFFPPLLTVHSQYLSGVTRCQQVC